MRGGAETAPGFDAFGVGRPIPGAVGGEQRGAGALAHGQGTIPAGDHGRNRRPAHPQGGDHERGADRQDRRFHPQSAGLLHGLRPGSHPRDATDAGHGTDLFQRQARANDTGHAGAAGQDRREKPLFRQHHHEEEFPRWPHHHRGREQRNGPCQPSHQGVAGGRG